MGSCVSSAERLAGKETSSNSEKWQKTGIRLGSSRLSSRARDRVATSCPPPAVTISTITLSTENPLALSAKTSDSHTFQRSAVLAQFTLSIPSTLEAAVMGLLNILSKAAVGMSPLLRPRVLVVTTIKLVILRASDTHLSTQWALAPNIVGQTLFQLRTPTRFPSRSDRKFLQPRHPTPTA